MSAKKLGLRAATEQAMQILRANMDEGSAEAGQLPLIPLELEAEAEDQAAGGGGARRGAGRPPGSKNKSTEDWTRYILSRYRSPLEALAETMSRPVQLLAAELRCSLLDAFKLQLQAAKELGPYLHQKQPVAINVDQRTAINLALSISPEFAARLGVDPDGEGVLDADFDVVDDPETESEGNQ